MGGVRLSLTKILEGQKTNTKNYVRRKSVTILLNDLKKLEVTPGNFLNNVNAKLEYDGLVWKSIELFADSLDERDFQKKMHPNVFLTFQKIKVTPQHLYLDMMLIFASLLF